MRLIDMGIIDRINARTDLTTHARHVVLAKDDYARLLGIARAVERYRLGYGSSRDRVIFDDVSDALVEDSIDDLDAALAGEGE